MLMVKGVVMGRVFSLVSSTGLVVLKAASSWRPSAPTTTTTTYDDDEAALEYKLPFDEHTTR